jgi:hypothetical protein
MFRQSLNKLAADESAEFAELCLNQSQGGAAERRDVPQLMNDIGAFIEIGVECRERGV